MSSAGCCKIRPFETFLDADVEQVMWKCPLPMDGGSVGPIGLYREMQGGYWYGCEPE